MKKYLTILTIFLVTTMMTLVSATPLWGVNVEKIKLYQKDPTTWNIVPYGNGEVTLSYVIANDKILAQRARVSVWQLEPKTEYTLIYYGNEDFNDVWPYATCIKSFKTNTKGYAKSGSGAINFYNFFGNGQGEKFWVVKSADVDCENKMMINWNPTSYLFEHNTI